MLAHLKIFYKIIYQILNKNYHQEVLDSYEIQYFMMLISMW